MIIVRDSDLPKETKIHLKRMVVIVSVMTYSVDVFDSDEVFVNVFRFIPVSVTANSALNHSALPVNEPYF